MTDKIREAIDHAVATVSRPKVRDVATRVSWAEFEGSATVHAVREGTTLVVCACSHQGIPYRVSKATRMRTTWAFDVRSDAFWNRVCANCTAVIRSALDRARTG